MNGIQTSCRHSSSSSVYCGSFPEGHPSPISDSLDDTTHSGSGKFGPYSTPEQQKMYDTYLVKLNPKAEYCKNLSRKYLSRIGASEITASTPPRPPATQKERERIRELYANKAKERKVKMYEQALLIAEEREREEGKKFRAQRTIKFNVNYQTYFGQNVAVVGSPIGLGGWNPSKALTLSWTPGNMWSGNATLSTDDGIVEYKYILVDTNTGSIQWESGFNHKINTTEMNSPTIVIEDRWGSGSL